MVVFVVAVLFVVVLAEGVGVEYADEAILEAALSEVDDQAEFEVRGTECCAECIAVCTGDIVVISDDVEEETVFYEEVRSDCADDFFVKLYINLVLGRVRHFFDLEFFDERLAVDIDRVARAEFFVDFDSAAYETAA